MNSTQLTTFLLLVFLSKFTLAELKLESAVGTINGEEVFLFEIIPHIKLGLQAGEADHSEAFKKVILESIAKEYGVQKYPFERNKITQSILESFGIIPQQVTNDEVKDYFDSFRNIYLKREKLISFKVFKFNIDRTDESNEPLAQIPEVLEPVFEVRSAKESELSATLRRKLRGHKSGAIVNLGEYRENEFLKIESITPMESGDFLDFAEQVEVDCLKAKWEKQLSEWEDKEILRSNITVSDGYKSWVRGFLTKYK